MNDDNDGTTLHESGGVVQPTDAQIHNPWRESLENCITGDNYLRSTEWHQLIEELDRLYAIEALAVPQAPLQAEPVPVVASEPADAQIEAAFEVHRRSVSPFTTSYPIFNAGYRAALATPQAEPVPVVASPHSATENILRLATECAHKLATPANWHALRSAVEALATPQAEPGDPMEWPLPCDVTVGHGTMRKGVKLRTLVLRMKSLYKMATGSDADEVSNRTPEERQALSDAFVAKIQPDAQAEPAVAEPGGILGTIKSHPNYVAGFKAGHAAGRARAALASQSTPPPEAQVEYELDRAFKAGMAYQEKLTAPAATVKESSIVQSTPPPESAGQGLSDVEIDEHVQAHLGKLRGGALAMYRGMARDILAANHTPPSESAAPVPVEAGTSIQNPITEEMHVAAVKVLLRASGVDGLPQRMLDAMLAANPTAQPDGGGKA